MSDDAKMFVTLVLLIGWLGSCYGIYEITKLIVEYCP